MTARGPRFPPTPQAAWGPRLARVADLRPLYGSHRARASGKEPQSGPIEKSVWKSRETCLSETADEKQPAEI